MNKLLLAQVDIARRMRGALDDPVMRDFVARLEEMSLFPPDEELVRNTDWSTFEPCPASSGREPPSP